MGQVCFQIGFILVASYEVFSLLKIKKRGYSTAALRTKDWRKLIFVPAFSVLFLFIVWALTKLIELSL